MLDPAHKRMLSEVERHGHFTVGLVPKESLWLDESAHFPIHDSVIRPILNISSEAWVYGMEPNTAVYAAAEGIVELKQGKWLIDSTEDPIRGHELFWNASGGKRGSIVAIAPVDAVNSLKIFQHCRDVWVFGNLGAGHTPSAIRFAKSKAKNSELVCFLLSRNNGIEWLNVLCAPSIAAELYLRAYEQVERTW